MVPEGAKTSCLGEYHQYSMYYMAAGRVDKMLAEIQRAEELDPLNLYPGLGPSLPGARLDPARAQNTSMV
jgi:hypothetical protein